MNALKWIVLLGLGGYVAFVVALYFGQRTMLYFPQSTPVSPAAAGLPEAEEVVLPTSDGEQVIAWHVPPRPGQPVVIYFHGNAEVVATQVARHRDLIAGGAGLLALSYRGYMGSTGTPTEDGLLRDAEAAYQFAVSCYSWDRIVLWGHSLGSGVAVALAATRPVAKLILESPFSSTADVAASMYPIVPVRWLMHDQYHSDQRIDKVKASILILHGDRIWWSRSGSARNRAVWARVTIASTRFSLSPRRLPISTWNNWAALTTPRASGRCNLI